jgi:hypothetical protein
MFRVDVATLKDYFAFDPSRKPDLERLDALIRKAAPSLKRYFHKGTPPGQPGMRYKMIGYGRSFHLRGNGVVVEWPVVGVALQKNYISVYFSMTKDGAPITQEFAGRLGELRTGRNNFSFEAFDELDRDAVARLVAEAARIFEVSGAGR